MTFAGVSCTCSLEYIFHELQQIASKYLKNKGTNNNHTLAIISIANSPPCGREQELQVPLVSLLTSPLRTVNYFRTKYLHYFVALFTNFFKSSNISIKLFYHIITNFSWKIFLSHFHSSCSLLAPILVMKAKTAFLVLNCENFLRFWHNCSTVLSIHPEFGGIATMKLIKSHKAGYCIFFVWSWVLGEIDIFDCRSVLAILFIKVPLLFIKITSSQFIFHLHFS